MNDFDFSTRAAVLRQQFDATFAALPSPASEAMEDFLAVRVAGDPFALRVADLARLGNAPAIVHVPSRRSSVVGIAAIRGVLVSVHSLAALLGHARRDEGDALAWIALARAADTIALAFEKLERFVRVPMGTAGVLVESGITRPIVDVGAVIDTIKQGAAR